MLMLNIASTLNTDEDKSLSHRLIKRVARAQRLFIIGVIATITLTGCGQKGELYLADSSPMLTDADGRVLEQAALPEVSDDANDY